MSLSGEFLRKISEISLGFFGAETITNTDQKICFVTERLFLRAKSRIRIVDPGIPPRFYNDKAVLKGLEEAAERGVEIEILHGSDIDLAKNELSRLNEEGKIKLIALKTAPPLEFWVVDEEHALVAEGQLSSRFHGKTNDLSLGRVLDQIFTALKGQAQTQ